MNLKKAHLNSDKYTTKGLGHPQYVSYSTNPHLQISNIGPIHKKELQINS